MTGAEYDGAIKALHDRIEAAIDGARRQLIDDAKKLTDMLDGRAEILARHERVSDLVATSSFFSAIPIRLQEDDKPRSVGMCKAGVFVDVDPQMWASGRPQTGECPAGDYILVVALVPRAKP